jgi:copper chaperone CopZ
MAIDWELEDLDGVVEARTSYAKSRTEVRFDAAKVGQNDLVAAIQRAGYAARPVMM